MSETPGIYAKLVEIQKRITGLEKNGVGPQTQGGYKFLAVDDILLAVRPLLNEYGVLILPELLDHGFHYNTAVTKDDGRVARENIQSWVKYRYRFLDSESGTFVDVVTLGEAVDSGDKSVRKSSTQAQKVALIQAFSIVTGDADPDSEDGGAVARDTPAAPASRTEQNIAKAGQKSAPQANNRVKELQDAIKAAAEDRRRVEPDFQYLAFGKALLGKDAQGWTSDAEKLQKVLEGIQAGETV